MNIKFLPLLVIISAIAVSSSAAFYSITGLGKLFSGAELPVIIMATTLEISKIIIAATLHQYWNNIKLLVKSYLIIATIILMIITSAGIYGFLSNAYQLTYTKDLQTVKQIELVELKKENYISVRDELIKEKTGIIASIDQLRNSLGNNIQQSVDRKTGQLIKTSSNENRKSYERQLDDAVKRRDKVADQIAILNDSITNSEIKIIEIQSNSTTGSELGPLKYLSNLTGKSMDVIVNWFLILLIIVFDPLAIALVITAASIVNLKPILYTDTDRSPGRSIINKPESIQIPSDAAANEEAPKIIDQFIKENGLESQQEIVHELYDQPADEDYDVFSSDQSIKKKMK